LHLEVAVVAPGCAAAGWWQATRALSGNGLSWVYSVEWPAFALIAIAGWWHLIHEDPESYKARKARASDAGPTGPEESPTPVESASRPSMAPGSSGAAAVDAATAQLAVVIAALVGVEFILGGVTLFSVPFGHSAGWLPGRGTVIFVVHAVVGLLVTVASAGFLIRVRGSARPARLVGWIGCSGVALAAAGGLLVEAQSLVRFSGIALMFVGSMIAGFSYLIPAANRSEHESRSSTEALGELTAG